MTRVFSDFIKLAVSTSTTRNRGPNRPRSGLCLSLLGTDAQPVHRGSVDAGLSSLSLVVELDDMSAIAVVIAFQARIRVQVCKDVIRTVVAGIRSVWWHDARSTEAA